MIRNLFLSGAAAALVVAPLAAQAAPPRVSAPVSAEEELRGGSMVLPILIAVGLAIVLYMAIDSEDDIDVPFSP
jgi:hypothetical protein